MKRPLSALLLLLALAGCFSAPPEGDTAIIADLSKAWDEALNTKDLDTLTMLYTADARIMPPNGVLSRGAEGVRANFGSMMEAGLGGETQIVEISMSGALAHKIGTYKITAGDEVVDTGKFIETWLRGADGKWRITNDIWNSDMPPARPARHEMGGMGHPHVMILHEVADGERWLAAWRGEDGRRKLFHANGAAHVHTFQDPDNPNLTGLVVAVKDMDAFRKMLASDTGRAAATEDGVDLDNITMLIEAK